MLEDDIAEWLWNEERYISPGWEYMNYLDFDRLPRNTQNLFKKKARALSTLIRQPRVDTLQGDEEGVCADP